MFRSDLTHEEVVAGTRALQSSIERYAELIVRKGVAVQPGQEVVVSAPVETAPFARLLVRKAYAAGAGHGYNHHRRRGIDEQADAQHKGREGHGGLNAFRFCIQCPTPPSDTRAPSG